MLALSALQHLAVAANSLVYPMILAREAGLSGTALLSFVSVSMLGLGVATLLFCARTRLIGSGYLCPAGYTQIYLGPSLYALQHGGLSLVYGMTVVAGLMQLGIAPVLRRLRALLPPEIAGLVIAVVGLSLASLGVKYSLGIGVNQRVLPEYVAVAVISLVTMIVFNIWTKGYTKIFCALIGIVVGYAVSAALGLLDLSAAIPKVGLAIVTPPALDHVGWQFEAVMLAPFLVVTVATTLRVMGDVSNAERLNDADWVRPDLRSLSRGVASNGLASMFCGMVGTTGINSYSACIGLSGATGITSRVVGYASGVAFIALAFVPAAAVVFAAMPAPVMGAALFFSSAFVFTAGLQMITARMLDSRKTIVIGFSFAMALMADVYRDVFTGVPAVLQPIFGNALVLGTLCAVLLNLVMRIGVRQRVSLRLESGPVNRDAVEQFLSEHGARWAARRDIVNRATFGAVQVLEVLGDVPGGVEIETSFDEFSLNVRIRYVGMPLVVPEQRPTPRDIISSEEGERLLAGYLLRRSADRVISRSSGERAEVYLHYDH